MTIAMTDVLIDGYEVVNDFESKALDCRDLCKISLHGVFTGDTTGTLKIQVSNEKNIYTKNPDSSESYLDPSDRITNWVDLDDVMNFNDTDGYGSDFEITITNGNSVPGTDKQFLFNINDVSWNWLRVVFTHTSSNDSPTLTVYCSVR